VTKSSEEEGILTHGSQLSYEVYYSLRAS